MNRLLAVILTCLLIPSPVLPASVPMRDWLDRRFNPKTVDVRPVQGITERVVDGKLHLRLRDFLELVLRNSTEINLARLDVYTTANSIIAAHNATDPLLSLGFTALRSISQDQTGETSSGTLSELSQTSFLNYQQLFPTGQTLTVQFNAVRSSSNAFSSETVIGDVTGYPSYFFYNPNLLGTLNVTLAQPLIQNRTNIQYKGPLEIARTQLIITSEVSQESIADIVSAAANQYWEAVRDRDNIKVEQQTVDLAQKSYARDKQALDLGALASLDIFQSETQVAERNRDLVQAQYTYKVALDGLRRLIGADLTPETRGIELVLDDDPSALPPKSSVHPFDQALAEAMRVRPTASAARRRINVDDINARLSRDLLKPKLDLTAQLASNSLSGNQVPLFVGSTTSPVVTGTGLGSNLGQLLGFNYPSYGGGVQLTLPFRNSTARANLSDALVNKVRDRYTERQVQQQITLDVRQAINALELANATIDAATTARDLAGKNVQAEQQKYELGTITAFEVLDSQNRLASSESALLNAFVTYQEAYVNYERATWILLDGLGMVLETPRVR